MKRSYTQCKNCPLKGNKKVYGCGSEYSGLVFIGMNPGRVEIKTKEPFTGPAGARLNIALRSIEIRRDSIWITNVVKCYLPNNADPSLEAGQCCSRLLHDELLGARLVIPLGKFALKCVEEFQPDLHAEVFPMIHPAAAKRNGLFEAKLRQQTRKLGIRIKEVANEGDWEWQHGTLLRRLSPKAASS